MNDEEKDVYIKAKIKDGKIPERIENLFNNSIKIVENKGEEKMEENRNENLEETQKLNENNQSNKQNQEKKKMPVAAKRILATAACLVVLLGGGNIYASTQGYDNIFFLIAEKLGIAEDVFGKENILSDRDITISYKPIEISQGTQLQVNSLVIKDNEAKLKLQVCQGNVKQSVIPLMYVVKDENGNELYSNLQNNTTTLYGDVNCDGVVNRLDAVHLIRYLAGWTGYEVSEQGKINADVYKDGTINNRDYVAFLRHFAKWEGYETLPYIPETEQTATALYGDVNCDGEVNEDDATYLLRYTLNPEKYELKEEGKINADVNLDGKIDSNDAIIIQKYVKKEEGYEALPYVPETSEEKTEYKEELLLKNYKEDTKKLELEIFKRDRTSIVKLEIDLEKKEINVIGNQEEVTKISEEELKQYLGAFAMLSYKGTEYNKEMTENEKKTMTALLVAENNSINVDEGLYTKNNKDVRRVLNKEKIHKIIESFTDLEINENGLMEFGADDMFNTLTFKGKPQYIYELDKIGCNPTCLEVTDISYVGGIYNVTFKFCYSTEEDKGFGKTNIEDLPIYEMSVGLILDETNEYSKYRVSTMSEVTLVKEKTSNNEEISNETLSDAQAQKIIQGFLNIICAHESSSTHMLQIEEIGLIKDNEEWIKISNTNERDNEGYIKTHIKFSELKNKMLKYMTVELFETYSYSYKNVDGILWVMETGASGYSEKVQSVKKISSSESTIIYEANISVEAFDGRGENRNDKFQLQKNENGKYVVSALGWQIEDRDEVKKVLQNYLDLVDAYEATPAYLLYKLNLMNKEEFNNILGNNGYHTTSIKYADYKEAMLKYVSESWFNEKFANLYNKSSDVNEYLQFEQLGKSIGTNEVESITLKSNQEKSNNVAQVHSIYSDGVKGDTYSIEFIIDTFMENNNKKTVIAYCDQLRY